TAQGTDHLQLNVDKLVVKAPTQVTVSGNNLGNVTLADGVVMEHMKDPVVTVAANADPATPAQPSFVGTAPTSNAGQAQLKRFGNSYYWTLYADKTSGNGVKPGDLVPILPPDASAYTQMSGIDRE